MIPGGDWEYTGMKSLTLGEHCLQVTLNFAEKPKKGDGTKKERKGSNLAGSLRGSVVVEVRVRNQRRVSILAVQKSAIARSKSPWLQLPSVEISTEPFDPACALEFIVFYCEQWVRSSP